MRIGFRLPSWLAALVALSSGLGCHSGGTGLHEGSGGYGPRGGTAGGGQAGTGGSGGSTMMCYADFPCTYTYRCSGSGYQQYESRDCHSSCGPGPCSGETCEAVGSEIPCPAGTRCVGNGANTVSDLCRRTDAGVDDARSADGGAADAGVTDVPGIDSVLKPPADGSLCEPGATVCQDQSVLTCDATGVWKKGRTSCPYACSQGACVGECAPGSYQCQGTAIQRCNSSGFWEASAVACPDACLNGQCVESCKQGQQRCKDLVPQSCSSGSWQDGRACLYACSAGTCTGECAPGSRRCRDKTAQTCSNDGVFADQQTCSGASPICAGGQCVGSCLDAGQDCTDPKTACCQGSECVSSDGKTFTCRAISCAAAGNSCSAAADCCAGLDCTAGKCVARTDTCAEKPDDGECGGNSGAACCPGTVCGSVIGSSSLGCAIPTSTRPQDGTCPRDRPSQHDPCSAARFGLGCTYSDWASEPGVFYVCTCSYHGWSCLKQNYV